MGLLKPTDTELRELGLSHQSYMENLIYLSKICGMIKWSTNYSRVYYFCHSMLQLSLVSFVIGAAFEGDKVGVLEGIQNVFIDLIIVTGAASFHWYDKEYMTILQTMDRGIFNYEGTLDKETEKELEAIKSRARSNKKLFSQFYLANQLMIFTGLLFKKPFMYIIRGQGERLVDGENNLMRQGAFHIYMPYSQYWIPYIFGIVFCSTGLTVLDTCYMGYLCTYQFFSEELLSEFAMVNRTLEKVVSRAERLFTIRYSGRKFKDEQSSSEAMDECLRFCLTLSIKHHQQTLKLFNMFKQILFWPLFIMFLGWALMVCISFYLLLSDDVTMFIKVPLIPLVTSECLVAFIICYYGEQMSTANDLIGNSIYEGEGWTKHSRVLKPYASITRSYCYIPNALTAGGFGYVNHNMFAHLCSSAYSFMGFLLST